MKNLNAMLLCDFYKISHRDLYPKGTEIIYSTWTPRTSRMPNIDKVVVFGMQAFILDKLIRLFNEEFFSKPKEKVVQEYTRIIKNALGDPKPCSKHIEALHDLGFLPLEIKALPEGSVVPLRTPIMTIQNTHADFFWLTNYVETLASCELWQAATSATIAFQYRKILDKAAMTTVGNTEFVQFQGHDFSMRGMSSLSSAILSGMGHLLSFVGTDTIPAIQGTEEFYMADTDKELIGTSIPATEHSIQCAYGNDTEYYKRIMKVHPHGFVSIVSDGYDFWDVISRVVPSLKSTILARNGKLVVRPDSGDPVKIVCGDPNAETEIEKKGAIEALWDIFGGTLTDKGYKVLDSHIGLIYGDAITMDRASQIVDKLKEKGFASINVVFGIGSFTYQYNTRDTFGFALKSTLCKIAGIEKNIFKDPKTDDGVKKSQKGKVIVLEEKGSFITIDNLSLDAKMADDQLRTVFKDGKTMNIETFSIIRARLASFKDL